MKKTAILQLPAPLYSSLRHACSATLRHGKRSLRQFRQVQFLARPAAPSIGFAAWRRTACIELLFLALVVPLLWIYLTPVSSGLRGSSLLCLSALLAGLRYGAMAGIGVGMSSILMVTGSAFLLDNLHDILSKEQAICCLLAGAVGGAACDAWTRHLRRLEYLCEQHGSRLAQFTIAYQSLQLSHGRIEQQLGAGNISMHTALQRLQHKRDLCASSAAPLAGIAPDILALFMDATDSHCAAVYAIGAGWQTCLSAVATSGSAPQVMLSDPLVAAALDTGLVASVAANQLNATGPLAVVPLSDAGGKVLGLVLLHDMPFMRLERNTFDMLNVLGQHVGEIISCNLAASDELQALEAFRQHLRHQLLRAAPHAVPATVIAYKVSDGMFAPLDRVQLRHTSRGIDHSWHIENLDGNVVCVGLLALTDSIGAQSVLTRLSTKHSRTANLLNSAAHRLWTVDENCQPDELLAQLCHAYDLEAAPKDEVASGARIIAAGS